MRTIVLARHVWSRSSSRFSSRAVQTLLDENVGVMDFLECLAHSRSPLWSRILHLAMVDHSSWKLLALVSIVCLHSAIELFLGRMAGPRGLVFA